MTANNYISLTALAISIFGSVLPFYRKQFRRPKIAIHLFEPILERDGYNRLYSYLDPITGILINEYKIIWKFNVKLKNQSDNTAYEIIWVSPDFFKWNPSFNLFSKSTTDYNLVRWDYLESLEPNCTKECVITYIEQFKGTEIDFENKKKLGCPIGMPRILRLEYINGSGKHFFTEYDYSKKEEKIKSGINWIKII